MRFFHSITLQRAWENVQIFGSLQTDFKDSYEWIIKCECISKFPPILWRHSFTSAEILPNFTELQHQTMLTFCDYALPEKNLQEIIDSAEFLEEDPKNGSSLQKRETNHFGGLLEMEVEEKKSEGQLNLNTVRSAFSEILRFLLRNMEDHFDTGAWFLSEENIKKVLENAKIKFNKEVLRHTLSNLLVVNVLLEHLDSHNSKIYEVNLNRLYEFMPKIVSGLREDEERNGFFTLKDVYKHIDLALGWNKEEISVNAEFIFKGILDSLYFMFNIIVQTEKGFKFTDFSTGTFTDYKSYAQEMDKNTPSPFGVH